LALPLLNGNVATVVVGMNSAEQIKAVSFTAVNIKVDNHLFETYSQLIGQF